MSIPNPFRPVCGPAGGELPYIQPQYKSDLSGYVVEPSVPTTITRTGWSGDPTDTDGKNPLYAFLGRSSPVRYTSGNVWYYDNQKMIVAFEKKVRITKVGVLPIAYFEGRYLKGFKVVADGVEVGSVTGLSNENPVNLHEVAITAPRYASKIELVLEVGDKIGITQVFLTGTHKP